MRARRRYVRRGQRIRVAAVSCIGLALAGALAAGCGGSKDGTGGADADQAGPLTFIVPARAGSFLRTGPRPQLVLRGVGGAVALGAEGSGGGGSAGAIGTAALIEHADALLGPEPVRATLAGAEVVPQRYDLELRNPHYSAIREELSFDAKVVAGSPDPPPGSFGSATLTIASSLPGYELAGSVRERDPSTAETTPQPLAGALVTVRLGRLGIATAESGADGGFAVGPLPAGSYEVGASLAGYKADSQTGTLPPGDSPLELGLESEPAASSAGAG